MSQILKRCLMLGLLMILSMSVSAQGSLNCQATQSTISRTNASSTGIRSQASGYARAVRDVIWASNNSFLLGIWGDKVRVLCNTSGTPVIVPSNRVLGDITLNSTNRFVAFTDSDNLILADLTDGRKVLKPVNFTPTAIRFFPTGRKVAIGTGDGKIQVWDTTNFQWTRITTYTTNLEQYGIMDIEVTDDGRYLIVAIQSSGISVWDLSSLPTLNAPIYTSGVFGAYDVSVSPTGDIVAATWAYTAANPSIRVFKPISSGTTQTWQESYTITNLGEDTLKVEFSPDGALIASYTRPVEGQPTQVKLWDAATGALVSTLNQVTNMTFHGIAFRPDGGLLAVSSDKEVKLWGVQP